MSLLDKVYGLAYALILAANIAKTLDRYSAGALPALFVFGCYALYLAH